MKGKQIFQTVACMCASVMLLGVASCEKMKIGDSDDVGEGANVVLRVGSFEQVPFSLARTRSKAVGDVCTRLNFLVYKDGERIRQEAQQADGEGFGEAQFRLPQGHYYLVVLAHSSDGNPTSTNPRKIAFTNSTGYSDTFLYADSLVVESTDVERSLNLKRIVSMVRFIFEDPVPAKADRIQFYYTGGSGTLDAANDGWGVVQSKQTQWRDITHTEKKFEIYTIPHVDETEYLKVTATTYQQEGDNENILTEKEIEDIPVLRNHITTCRGYLFSPVYKMNFTITVDDEWDKDTIDFHF